MRIAHLSLSLLLVMPLRIAAAQPQEGSLGDAARRARDNKASQSASKKVWTNEDIPQTPGSISVVGSAPPAPATENPAAASATTSDNTAKSADKDAKRASLQSELDGAKERLATVMTDLDILVRKHTLDSQTYYGKPDYASDKAGASQLQDEQDQIDAKKQEVDQAQKKVEDLKAQIDVLSSDQPAVDSGKSSNGPAPANSPNPSSEGTGSGTANPPEPALKTPDI